MRYTAYHIGNGHEVRAVKLHERILSEQEEAIVVLSVPCKRRRLVLPWRNLNKVGGLSSRVVSIPETGECSFSA
jgi:hypothetical protein